MSRGAEPGVGIPPPPPTHLQGSLHPDWKGLLISVGLGLVLRLLVSRTGCHSHQQGYGQGGLSLVDEQKSGSAEGLAGSALGFETSLQYASMLNRILQSTVFFHLLCLRAFLREGPWPHRAGLQGGFSSSHTRPASTCQAGSWCSRL